MSGKRVLLAALLSTTLLATPAKADPVTAFVGGFLNALGAGTYLASAAVGAWGAGFTAASWLAGGGFLSQVLSVGLSALSQGLMSTPKVASPSDRMVNWAQPVSYMEVMHGRVRKGGPLALSAASKTPVVNPTGTDKRAKRHYGVLIAAHSTLGPVQHYLDKWPVEVDGAGFVTTEPVNAREGSEPWLTRHWHGSIRAHTGQPGQVVDAIWDAVFAEVSSTDDFAGLSYAALYAARPKDNAFSRIYPSGKEWTYTAVWDGSDTVYDPRSDSYGWSNNAALVIADLAQRYGRAVDWDEVAAEADVSDQLVTNRSGGTQKRWTINITTDTSMGWEAVRAELQKACDAFFFERRDGKLGFKVGYYSAPTVTLTAADFISLTVRNRDWGADVIGQVVIRYVEPARDYEEEVTGAIVADPDGARHEEPCGAIDSHNQAWRVGWRWLTTARPEYAITGTIKAIGYECMEERFLRIQHAELGLDAVVEVGKLGRTGGSHTFSLDAVSVEPGDFAPDAMTLEPPRPLRVKIVEEGEVSPPESLSGSAIEGTGGAALIEWTWPAQPDDVVQQLRIRAPGAGIDGWQIVDAGDDQSSLVSAGLVDGAAYEAQVRNRTPGGRVSVWAPEDPIVVTAVAESDPPGTMAAFGGALAGSDVALTFTAPNDAAYAAARIYRATGSTSFGDAALIHTEFGAPNLADTYTDIGPGVGAHRYWCEPINASGIAGPRSGPVTVTVI